MRPFSSLSEQEVLALAISNEEEDGRILADFADSLKDLYPDSARIFSDMAQEEGEHRRRLLDIYVERFGSHVPLVRRQDIKGVPARKPAWQVMPMGIEAMRGYARQLEVDASRFYTQAAGRATDAGVRRLLGDLAAAEQAHVEVAGGIQEQNLADGRREVEDDHAQRRFVLQIVQPGMVGLIDGSVSTLAPLFAAAFATHTPWSTFLVGMASGVGAGISMGMAEALSDDGKLSGRGNPLVRGLVCGLMTTVGGVGHALPYLIPDFWTATALAMLVVVLELAAIAWIQWRWMETSLLSSVVKIALGGSLVLAVGVLIGSG